MCGIVGISGLVNEVKLQKGVSLLSHRGPDDSGIFIDKEFGIGLGHTRLSIQDLSSAGHQPMADTTGNIVLVFNGEIYNFNELRVELEGKGYSFYGNSDTEVLLNLYIDLGKEMFTHLNGIFALAIWDKRNESLLIARDALGVKPLYYTKMQTGSVAFASEIKALLKLLPCNTELDVESINRYLAFLWCPGSGTPLKSIEKLLPGEVIVIKDGSIVDRWSWYKLPIFNNPKQNINKEKAISRLKKEFWFFGLTERFNEGLVMLRDRFQQLGFSFSIYYDRKNRGPKARRQRKNLVTKKVLLNLREKNILDYFRYRIT